MNTESDAYARIVAMLLTLKEMVVTRRTRCCCAAAVGFAWRSGINRGAGGRDDPSGAGGDVRADVQFKVIMFHWLSNREAETVLLVIPTLPEAVTEAQWK